MKSKSILAGIAAVVLMAPLGAQAADLAPPVYKAPAYIAPLFSWSGLYFGLNGGYMWGNSQWSGGAGNFDINPRGWMGGGTVGYNFQAGRWLWGLEGDIDYADLKGTDTSVCGGCTIKDTWLGTARGRLGYATRHWLSYVTGGAAFGNAYVSTPGGAVDRTKVGWTAGLGFEYALLGNWSAKLEYLYVDLGSATCAYTTCAIPTDATVHFTSNILRAGLNYRF